MMESSGRRGKSGRLPESSGSEDEGDRRSGASGSSLSKPLDVIRTRVREVDQQQDRPLSLPSEELLDKIGEFADKYSNLLGLNRNKLSDACTRIKLFLGTSKSTILRDYYPQPSKGEATREMKNLINEFEKDIAHNKFPKSGNPALDKARDDEIRKGITEFTSIKQELAQIQSREIPTREARPEAGSSHRRVNPQETREQKKARYEELSKKFWDIVLEKYGDLPCRNLPHNIAAFLAKSECDDFKRWTDSLEAAHNRAVRESGESLSREQEGRSMLERNLKAFAASLISFDKTHTKLKAILSTAEKYKKELDSNTDEAERVIDSFTFFMDRIQNDPAVLDKHKIDYEGSHYNYIHGMRHSNPNNSIDSLEEIEMHIIKEIAPLKPSINLTAMDLVKIDDQYEQAIAANTSEEAQKQAKRNRLEGYRNTYSKLLSQ
jgi:hypothetical protein